MKRILTMAILFFVVALVGCKMSSTTIDSTSNDITNATSPTVSDRLTSTENTTSTSETSTTVSSTTLATGNTSTTADTTTSITTSTTIGLTTVSALPTTTRTSTTQTSTISPSSLLKSVVGGSELIYATWEDTNPSNATVSYKLDTESAYTDVDSELIRSESSSLARVDILGLKAGVYDIKIVTSSSTTLTQRVNVYNYDRSGYAHFNVTQGVGAYNNDGSLKDNAVVVYVTNENKNTVQAEINEVTYTGLANILGNQSKSSNPLVIRIIGTIETQQWNAISCGSGGLVSYNPSLTLQAYTEEQIISNGINSLSNDAALGITKLNGLVNKLSVDGSYFDSYFNMMDVKDARNVTVEGVGDDALIYQWGFTWKNCSYIEVRNLTFDDYTEDACSFEGPDDVATIKGFTTGHIWVHNNKFNEGKNNWDVTGEQDKAEGDGATDLKKNAFITISYNHYYLNHKTGLVGGSDSQHTACVTFHHNYYDQCSSRLPLGRQANMHMYNNYYYASSGTNMSIRASAYAFIEGCYFQNITSTTIEVKSSAGVKSYNNVIDNCSGVGGTTVNSRTATVTNSNSYGQNFDTDSSIFYYDSENQVSNVEYLTSASQAKTDALLYAGVYKGNANTMINKIVMAVEAVVQEEDMSGYTEVFSQNFDSLSDGSISQETNTTVPYFIISDNTSNVVTDTSANNAKITSSLDDGKTLYITDSSTTYTTECFIPFGTSYTTGTYRIDVEVTPSTNASKWELVRIYSDATNYIAFKSNADKNIILCVCLDGTTTEVTASSTYALAAGGNYIVSFEIDLDLDKVSLYFTSGGVKNTVNEDYSFALPSIAGLRTITSFGSTRNITLDNILVYKENE